MCIRDRAKAGQCNKCHSYSHPFFVQYCTQNNEYKVCRNKKAVSSEGGNKFHQAGSFLADEGGYYLKCFFIDPGLIGEKNR